MLEDRTTWVAWTNYVQLGKKHIQIAGLINTMKDGGTNHNFMSSTIKTSRNAQRITNASLLSSKAALLQWAAYRLTNVLNLEASIGSQAISETFASTTPTQTLRSYKKSSHLP